MHEKVVEKLEFPRQSRGHEQIFPELSVLFEVNGLVSADITGDGLLYFETTKTILNKDVFFFKFRTDVSFF
jgi:hypothetical protein